MYLSNYGVTIDNFNAWTIIATKGTISGIEHSPSVGQNKQAASSKTNFKKKNKGFKPLLKSYTFDNSKVKGTEASQVRYHDTR